MSSLVFVEGGLVFSCPFSPLGTLLYISCILWVLPRFFFVVLYPLLLSIKKIYKKDI